MFAGLGKMTLHNCKATWLINKYDVIYVKTTLLQRKYHVNYVISTYAFCVIFTLEELRKKVFPF